MALRKLVIKDDPSDSRIGWRIYDGDTGTYDHDPDLNEGDEVQWTVEPASVKAYVAILDDSPFADANGVKIENRVLEVNRVSPVVTVMSSTKRPAKAYEYAVLVKGKKDKTIVYVRGAASPPGVVVGGP